MGTIEPLAYVLPGFTTYFGNDPVTALKLSRTANVVLSSALFGVGLYMYTARGRLLGAGIAAALTLTPMVVYVGSSTSPSAVELASAFCLTSTLLSATRPTQPNPTRATWMILGISATLLATSRSFGPVWIVVTLATVVAFVSPTHIVSLVRNNRSRALMLAIVISAAAATTIVWEIYYQPGLDIDLRALRGWVRPSFGERSRVSKELIGVFGSVNIPMRGLAYQMWTIAVVILGVAAGVLGTLRQRVVMGLSIATTIAVSVGISAGIMKQNGFDLQGRHILSIAMTIPLVAGETLVRHQGRLPGRMLSIATVVTFLMAAVVHVHAIRRAGAVYGWRAQRQIPDAWLPPMGSRTWEAITVVAGVVLVAAAAVAIRGARDLGHPPPSAEPG